MQPCAGVTRSGDKTQFVTKAAVFWRTWKERQRKFTPLSGKWFSFSSVGKKMKCSTLTLLGRPFLVYTIVYLNLISNGSCYRIWHLLFCQHNKGSSVSLTNKLSYSPFSREDKKVQQTLWLLQCRLHSDYTFAMCQLHIGTSEVLRLHVSIITHFLLSTCQLSNI